MNWKKMADWFLEIIMITGIIAPAVMVTLATAETIGIVWAIIGTMVFMLFIISLFISLND